jgi:hypothetical protein
MAFGADGAGQEWPRPRRSTPLSSAIRYEDHEHYKIGPVESTTLIRGMCFLESKDIITPLP